MPLTADLAGRTALVTGASSGLGRRFARVLAGAGAEVIVAARRQEELAALVAEIEGAGGRAGSLVLDVADAEAVEAAIGALPALDILVNNAGMAGASRAIDCPPEEWRRTFEVNVHGAFFVAQAAARRMRALGVAGAIVNIASINAFRPGATAAAYSASKAAVAQMTAALAMEWARFGIRVNALAPGYFETDLNREFLRSDFGQAMMKRIPQRRFGEEGDLDGPLLLLASDASSYMTGSVVVVDGGHLVGVL
jgi:NAD(P)-dependent dehydrogenase (short-subunit alcohol dehydrogenase family)